MMQRADRRLDRQPLRLPYSCGDLDRGHTRRSDAAWLAAALASPTSRVIPMWRDKCLVVAEQVVSVAWPLASVAEPAVFLGCDDAVAVFAVDLSALEFATALDIAGATDAVEVRALVATLSPAEASTIAYARGLLHWHRQQRFCGACGAAAEVRDAGHLRACGNDACGRLLFPRIEPAVIMLVESVSSPDRCLLGRHRGAASFSTLAGFVEIGESLEDAVRREVFEEAGVRVGDVEYQASQAWPFPSGIMIGFRARALDDAVAVDRDELDDAQWFTRAQVEAQIQAVRAAGRQPDSIGSFLVESWVRAGD